MTCREGHAPRHPDFGTGNTVAMKHGARSPRVVEPVAAALREQALKAAPYLADPRWTGELEAWSRAEARVQILLAWEERVGGPLAEDGSPRSHLVELERAERRAQNARDRLGLNPASAARLASYLASAQRGPSLLQVWEQAEGGEQA